MAPLGKLVAPGGRELRAAQTFRILGGEHLRHRAVRPFEAAARRNPGRPLVALMHGQQAGHALDHHLAGVVLGLADQRDRALLAARRSATRLTHSAPARVLPAPRPPSSSQVVQSPDGGFWCLM